MIVGLTGGIASGKTTVANLFQSHFNIDLIDADLVARHVVEPGTVGLSGIVEKFGTTILTGDGALNRSKLREIIFSDDNAKVWLNNHLHPLIRRQILQDMQTITSEYGILVVPLFVEGEWQKLTDRVLVVDVAPETQISRTMQRDNVSENQVRSILKSQASREQRLAIATDVIDNSGKNDELLPQVTKLHKKYLAMCRSDR
jgi:dephospho-CoA kinase